MYVITHHHDYDEVLLGPVTWNPKYIASVLRSDLDLDYTPSVTASDESKIPYEIISNVWVRPVVSVTEPINEKIQYHVGPYWSYTPSEATATYVATLKDIDVVKGELKTIIASERYKKEISGVKVTIQGQEVSVDTNRGDRDIFVQKYILMGENETVNWKFPEGWLTLTKSELGQIVSAGATHVQMCFDWESAKVAEIDACVDHAALDNVILVFE
jgi:hypothetical protein